MSSDRDALSFTLPIPTRSGHEKENQDRRCCRNADPVCDSDDSKSGSCAGDLSDVESAVADDPCLTDFGHRGFHWRYSVHYYPGKKEALRSGGFALLHPIPVSIIPRVRAEVYSVRRSIRSFLASLYSQRIIEGMLTLNTQQTLAGFPESSDVPGKF